VRDGDVSSFLLPFGSIESVRPFCCQTIPKSAENESNSRVPAHHVDLCHGWASFPPKGS